MDHFIDALPESEIRLRLREMGPTTLAMAERIAVRMDAHWQADKKRTRFVGKVEQNSPINGPPERNTEQRMESISRQIDMLSRAVPNLNNQQRLRAPVNSRNFPPTSMPIAFRDQIDLITVVCLLKGIFSPGEVIQ